MSNVSTKKVFVESVAEQQEHFKNQRNALKTLQKQGGVIIDKENLTGRSQTDKLSRLKVATDVTLATADYGKRKKVETRVAETQTTPRKQSTDSVQSITANDLTSASPPSELYWQKLAEKRRQALENTLTENQHLHERIEGLETELNTSRQLLDEARNLVEVLTEMLNENEAEKEIDNVGDEAGDNHDDDDDDDDDGSVTKSSSETPSTAHTPQNEETEEQP